MAAKRRPTGRERPLGILVLAVVQIVACIEYIGVALRFLNLSEAPADDRSAMLQLIVGIAFAVLGVLCIRLAHGYLQGHEWARRRGRIAAALAIVFALLAVLVLPSFLDPANPSWTIVFNLGIIAYLGRPKVRAYFRTPRESAR